MFRRTAVVATLCLALLALAVPPAFGWGNGGDGGNAYGTHDWALDHAIRLAGASASWVEVQTALLSSDDPDNGPNASSRYWHDYKNIGAAQGGPQAAADEYYQVVLAYNAGDYHSASMHLGRMSHYFMDICQPYHTDVRGASAINPRHYAYEVKVANMTARYSDRLSWLSAAAPKTITDVRATAISASLYARTKYAALDASYKSHGLDPDDYAFRATGLVLNRGVNDFADVIRAIPLGAGLAKAPAKMTQRMHKANYYYPRKGTSGSDIVRSDAMCYDAAGKPMRGVRVTFAWPLAKGLKYIEAYTDANGLAYSWCAPGNDVPLMKKRIVTAKVVTGSNITTSATWYVPTPVLAAGHTGFRTTISSHSPRRHTKVKVTSRVRTKSGKPVAGLKVTFCWQFKSGTVKVSALTNAKGYASTTLSIGAASKGHRVLVRAKTYSGRYGRNSSASFVPS